MKNNNSINIPFYVSTNDKHIECLRAFIDVFKYFLPNQELRILGYKQPDFVLPKNCSFISMGTQGDVKEWSTDLRNYFTNCSDKIFIYGTEDTFFYKKPSIDFINYLSDLVIKSDELAEMPYKIGRINLVDATEGDNCSLAESPHYEVDLLRHYRDHKWGSWSLYCQNKASNYSLTTQFSVWNKDFLLKYLVDNLSPWDFERQSFKAANDEKYKVFMVDNNFPIYKKEGYSLGTWTNKKYWLHFLSDEVKNDLF